MVVGTTVGEYYDDMSHEYDQLTGRYGWNLRSWVPQDATKAGTFVLDVACGTGLLGEILSPSDNAVVIHGCDLSPKMLATAKVKDHYEVLYGHDLNRPFPKKVQNVANGTEFETPQGFYDYAFCFGAFEWLKYKPLVRAISQVFGQVKSGGKFVFNTQLEPHPSVGEITVHSLQTLLDHVQAWCKIDRVDPLVAYTLPEGRVWYLVWQTTKL